MDGQLTFRYTIDGDDFTRAGEASSSVKNKLKMLGLSTDVIRRVAIAMYEGEINMVIHADGGMITVTVSDAEITMVLSDSGPGFLMWSRPCRKDIPPPARKSAPSASAQGWGSPI